MMQIFIGVKIEQRLPQTEVVIPLHRSNHELVISTSLQAVKDEIDTFSRRYGPGHSYGIIAQTVNPDGSFSTYEVIKNV